MRFDEKFCSISQRNLLFFQYMYVIHDFYKQTQVSENSNYHSQTIGIVF